MPTRRNTHMQSRAPTTTRRTEARTMVILHATAPIKPEAREQWFAHLEGVWKRSFSLLLGFPGPRPWWWRETVEHVADHHPLDHRFVGGGQTLVVTYQTTPAHHPGERSLHHPAAGQHAETALVGGLSDDLDDDPPG